MTSEQRMKNLSVPSSPVDVVLDTDTYNEIDDQFAIAYLLSCKEKLRTKAIYAAPFFNANSTGPADGMEKSYLEIFKVLDLMGERAEVFKGSDSFLKDEKRNTRNGVEESAHLAKSQEASKTLPLI